MPIRQKSIRGAKHVRTLSALREGKPHPASTFLRVAYLELEKIRRQMRKKTMLTDLKNLEARLAEIEAEKAALLRPLGEPSEGRPANSSPCNSFGRAFRRGTGSFPIKY